MIGHEAAEQVLAINPAFTSALCQLGYAFARGAPRPGKAFRRPRPWREARSLTDVRGMDAYNLAGRSFTMWADQLGKSS
jgi:hypothetical protein